MANDTYRIKIGGGVMPEVFASLSRLDANVAGFGRNFIANLAAPITTVFSGAVAAQFIFGAARAADALGDLREETGLTIQTLGGLKLTAAIKGLGEIDLPMRRFASAVREAQVEGTKFNDLFKKMGVDPMQDLDTVLFDVSDKFASWEDGINKLGIAEDLFGTKQAKFIQLLNLGADGLRDNITEFDRTHTSVSDASDAFDEYNKQVALLKSNFEGLAQSLTVSVAPALNGLLSKLRESSDGWRNLMRYFIEGTRSGNRQSVEDFMAKVGLEAIGAELAAGRTSTTPGSGGTAPNPSGPSVKQLVLSERARLEMENQRSTIATERARMQTAASPERLLMVEDSHMALMQSRLAEMRQLTADFYTELGDDATRFQIQDEQALLQLEQQYKSHLDRKLSLEKAHEEEKKRIRAMHVQGVHDMLGNLAIIAEAYGKKGLVAYRVFATAQAVIDTARAAIGAYASTVGIPYVGPIIAPIAAAAAVGAGAAQIAKINGAFMEGGYTGDLGTSQVAGVVHGREFVIPANRVNEFGVDFFEGIRTGEIKPAEASAVAGGGSGGGVNIGLINSRQERNEWMATEGAKIAYDYAERRRRR
jgi:hypothetical protein